MAKWQCIAFYFANEWLYIVKDIKKCPKLTGNFHPQHESLVEEGFDIGYTTVCNYVRENINGEE